MPSWPPTGSSEIQFSRARRVVHVAQQLDHRRGRHQVEPRQPRAVVEVVRLGVDPGFAPETPSSLPGRLRSCRYSAAPAPTARSASSACRFWLTLSVIRKSSSSGAEVCRASSMPASGGSGAAACVRSATSCGYRCRATAVACHRDPRSSSTLAQRHGGIVRRIFDAQQQSCAAVAQRNRAPEPRVPGCPARASKWIAPLAAGRHRPDAVVDAVILHRRIERQRRQVARASPGRTFSVEDVVVDGQRRNRRAVVGLRIVDATSPRRTAPTRTRCRRRRCRHRCA